MDLYDLVFGFKNRIRLYLLRKRGLKIGKDCYISGTAQIDWSVPHLITIGDECTLTDGVVLLAHDASTKRHLGKSQYGKVIIGNRTFIGVNAIILPNVRVGSNVVIGAGSVVTHDIPDNCVAVGNPARVIYSLNEFLAKHRD